MEYLPFNRRDSPFLRTILPFGLVISWGGLLLSQVTLYSWPGIHTSLALGLVIFGAQTARSSSEEAEAEATASNSEALADEKDENFMMKEGEKNEGVVG